MTQFDFSYDFGRESFTIAALDGSRTLVLPLDQKLSRVTHWPIWPQPLFVQGENGTEISINGERHGSKQVLFQNLEEDCFVRLSRREAYAWLKRPELAVFDGELCPQKQGTRVDVERTEIELFDFKNGIQANFAATLIDDDAVIGQHVRLDKKKVKGRKLEGGWFGGGGYISFKNPEEVKEGLEKFHADFATNLDECTRMCATGIGIDYSTNKRLYKGDPAKGEPLLTVHVMTEETQRHTYAAPDRVLEFYGREMAADWQAIEQKPIAETNQTAIYRVRGGYVVEVGRAQHHHEDFYLIDGLPWLIHAKHSIANTAPADIGPDLHVIDLERGMSLMCFSGIHGIGPSKLKRAMLQDFTSRLPDRRAAENIILMVAEGLMPTNRDELYRKGERGSAEIYSIPFKPTRQELKYIFDPKHYKRNYD